MTTSILANVKYKVQLLRDAHINNEFVACGEIIDVDRKTLKNLINFKVAVEVREVKEETKTRKK